MDILSLMLSKKSYIVGCCFEILGSACGCVGYSISRVGGVCMSEDTRLEAYFKNMIGGETGKAGMDGMERCRGRDWMAGMG